MTRQEVFLFMLMGELEVRLNSSKIPPQSISFHSDEANTDRQIKEFLKNFILTNCNGLQAVSFQNCIISGQSYQVKAYQNMRVTNVFLQDELTEEQKNLLRSSKNGVFTNPDLFLVIQDTNQTYYETIEVKSTKKDKIPGSSVQQVNPHEWTIFVLHHEAGIQFAISQYIHAVDNRIQFPDRSPRPEVSFKEIVKWNQAYRIASGSSLEYKSDPDIEDKYKIIADWQSYLAENWVNELYQYRHRRRIPWFHIALRKFILLFLASYEKLSEEKKKEFKEKTKEIIAAEEVQTQK